MKKINIKQPIYVPLLLGVMTGLLAYCILVAWTERKLIHKIESVSAQQVLVYNDPVLIGILQTDSKAAFSLPDFQYRVAKGFGIIARDDKEDKLGALIRKGLSGVFAGKNTYGDLFAPASTEEPEGALDFMIRMGYNIGHIPHDTLPDEADIRQLATLLGRTLAQAPYALDNYDEALSTVPNSLETAAKRKYFFAYAYPFTLGTQATPEHILTRFYAQTRITDYFTSMQTKTSNLAQISNSMEPEIERQQLDEWFTKILLRVLTDEDVAMARDWVMVFKGPMQLAMLILFAFALFLLYLPVEAVNFRAWFSSDQLQQYQLMKDQIYKFCDNNLPILGFIGTILGLMAALGDAYKIPIAGGTTQSALAISDITTTLSVAFTTTLMAFVLKIILELAYLIRNPPRARKNKNQRAIDIEPS